MLMYEQRGEIGGCIPLTPLPCGIQERSSIGRDLLIAAFRVYIGSQLQLIVFTQHEGMSSLMVLPEP